MSSVSRSSKGLPYAEKAASIDAQGIEVLVAHWVSFPEEGEIRMVVWLVKKTKPSKRKSLNIDSKC